MIMIMNDIKVGIGLKNVTCWSNERNFSQNMNMSDLWIQIYQKMLKFNIGGCFFS